MAHTLAEISSRTELSSLSTYLIKALESEYPCYDLSSGAIPGKENKKQSRSVCSATRESLAYLMALTLVGLFRSHSYLLLILGSHFRSRNVSCPKERARFGSATA
jgi:hypothetical protein